MNRLLRMSALALCLAPLAAAAEWVTYGESDGATYYFETRTLRKDAQKRRVWRLFDLKQARPDGVRSGKALVEIHCREQTYRYLRTLYYTAGMAQGKYLRGAHDGGTEHIAPGSVMQRLAERVCAD